MQSLAGLYCTIGKYSKAEELYKLAQAIVGESIGAEHPYAAIIISRLAEIGKFKGEYGEATALTNQAMEVWLQYLDPAEKKAPIDPTDLAAWFECEQSTEQRIQHLYVACKERTAESDLNGASFAVTALYELGLLHKMGRQYQAARHLFGYALKEQCLRCNEETLIKASIMRQIGESNNCLGDQFAADCSTNDHLMLSDMCNWMGADIASPLLRGLCGIDSAALSNRFAKALCKEYIEQ